MPRHIVGKVLHARGGRIPVNHWIEPHMDATQPAPASPAVASPASLDADGLLRFIDGKWDKDIVPQLVEYIRIPNKSPMFDAEWASHGHMDRAVELMRAWAAAQSIAGLALEIVQLPGRTPLIFIEIPATDRQA